MAAEKNNKAKPKVKCEFDKDSMYSKIMPTALKSETVVKEDLFEKKIQEMNDEAARNVSTNAPSKAGFVLSQPGISLLTPGKDYVLVNIMEYAVNQFIYQAVDRFNVCKCDRCLKDIAAMALNKLPAKYLVIKQEEIMENVAKCEVDVKSALVSAIMVVKAKPRH